MGLPKAEEYRRLLRESFTQIESQNAIPMTLHCLTVDQALETAADFTDLIELWVRRRGGQSVPDWRDMEFADFRGWHSLLCLSQFEGAEPDPLFRLFGEDAIDIAGFNPTGLRFSQFTPRLYDLQYREHFSRIRQTGLIGLTAGNLAYEGRGHIRLHILELPFRDGGPQVERLAHAVSVESDSAT